MATNTGFGFDIGLKPIDRTSIQYRDQQIDSQSQLLMMSIDPRMSQDTKANININRVRETSQVPMQSTNIGETFGYIDRNEPDNLNYKISDTDDKLAQLRSNMFKLSGIGKISGITKPLIEGRKETQLSNFPEDVKAKIAIQAKGIGQDIKRYADKIGLDKFEMLSDRGKAMVKLDEKEAYIADSIRKTQKIKEGITDRMLVDDFKEQKGDDFFREELDILNQEGTLNTIDRDILYGKFIPGAKTIEGFEEKSRRDRVKSGLSQRVKLGVDVEKVERLPGKEIKNPLDALPWLFRFASNIPAAAKDMVSFIGNILIAPDSTREMLNQLPAGLANIIKQDLEESKGNRGLDNIRNTANKVLTFINENPDVMALESPSKYVQGARDFTKIGLKSTIDTMKTTKNVPKYLVKTFEDLYKSYDNVISGTPKIGDVLPKTPDNLTKDMIVVTNDMKTPLMKGLKPTVIEKKGSQAIADFEKNVVSSIDTILDNGEAIKYLDELGDEISKTSPETMREFADAIRQSKKIVYNDYAADAAKAGEAGAVVTTQPIIDELTLLRDKLSKQIGQQNTIDYIDRTIADIQSKPTLDVMTAQDNVQTFNNQLQAFYRNPNYNDVGRTVVDALVNNMLRDGLDNAIETALDSPKYMAKKQRYGALKNIEKEVSKRAVVSERANTRGLIDFTDFVSADMAVNGILRTLGGDVVGGLGSIARGYSLNFIKNLYKKRNSPDYNLKQLIKKVKKAKEKGTLYSNKIDNVSIDSNPVSDLTPLENKAGLAEGQGLKAFKGEGVGGKVNTPGGEGTEFYTSSYDRALSYSKDGKVKEIDLNFKPEEIKEIDSKGIKWNTKVDKDGNPIKGLSNKGESNYIDYNNNKAKKEGYKAVVYKNISDTGPYNLSKLKSLDGDDIVLLKDN